MKVVFTGVHDVVKMSDRESRVYRCERDEAGGGAREDDPAAVVASGRYSSSPGQTRVSDDAGAAGDPRTRCSTKWLINVRRSRILNLMVDQPVMNDVFHALAHDARRAMLARLASGDLTVGELAEPFSMSLEAASKHIKVLERAGLIRRRIEGRHHICTLSPAPLASAYSWLGFYERFWDVRLDALEGLFAPGSKTKGNK